MWRHGGEVRAYHLDVLAHSGLGDPSTSEDHDGVVCNLGGHAGREHLEERDLAVSGKTEPESASAAEGTELDHQTMGLPSEMLGLLLVAHLVHLVRDVLESTNKRAATSVGVEPEAGCMSSDSPRASSEQPQPWRSSPRAGFE